MHAFTGQHAEGILGFLPAAKMSCFFAPLQGF